MAISTYAELQTAIGVWMGRPGDTVIATYAPDFISMFESWFKSRVRVRRMLTTTSLTIDAATETLPGDFLEVRNIYLTGSPNVDLQQAGLDWIRTQYDENSAGIPKHYNVGGSSILFAPKPDTSYAATLEYWAFAALSDSNTTNWLLTYYPHVYLRGALREAAGWEGGGPHESLLAYDAALKEAIADMEREDFRVNSASDSAMRSDTWTP
jgi:hypothetical protein